MAKSSKSEVTVQKAQAKVDLCAGVLPVWARQLASSRSQSEVAVSQMLQAFSDIGPHLDMAQRQSQQINDALHCTDDGVTGLSSVCNKALTPLLSNPALPADARTAITHVLELVDGTVAALENIARPFAQETKLVSEQVERMYLGFQYQDRISQMMALLEGDIARLQAALDANTTDTPELQDWLARLESQYAMSEQRQSHSAEAGGLDTGGDDKETTFF